MNAYRLTLITLFTSVAAALSATHPAMRPLPKATDSPLAIGPKHFVDAAKGKDSQAGTMAAPWQTLRHALRQLKPGDTLYLRGGVYHEHASLPKSGTQEAPITIASYPGELATIDGGLREFLDDPASSWQTLEGGAPGEFVSTHSFLELDDRQAPTQFIPSCWEPMWGVEEERPLALGHFADSMVPLHGYRNLADLRATNELWSKGGKKEMGGGMYCGPGLWFNRDTGRIHIRLAHTELAGLGDNAYRGETDPRKLPLVIAAGFGHAVLRVNGVKHVRIERIVLRGATGSPLLHLYGSENVVIDHCTLFGGFPALLVSAAKDLHVTHTAFRGLAAPWTGRSHMKYLGTASYQVILHDLQPLNENIELGWCEFTDDHDCAFLRFAKNLQFHHNYVDNFNDDGLECGPKMRDHTIFIHENRIGRILSVFTQHEIDKDTSPVDHDATKGVFIYRNVFDMRGGVYYTTPTEPDATGAYLHHEGHFVGDHGGPIWSVMHVYHNTLFRDTPVFRDSYLFGLGSQGLQKTERDVLNNIFIQTVAIPGVGFVGMKEPAVLREGGNILWGFKAGPTTKTDPFAKFRAAPLFTASKTVHPPGWTTDDFIIDPQFNLGGISLASDSPAVNHGQSIPPSWPDPLRDNDPATPDIGALPLNVQPWGIGIDGRLPLSTP